MDSTSTYTDLLNGSYVFLATMVVLVYDFVIHVDHEEGSIDLEQVRDADLLMTSRLPIGKAKKRRSQQSHMGYAKHSLLPRAVSESRASQCISSWPQCIHNKRAVVFIPTMEKLNNMECTIIDQIDLWILVMVLVCVECIFLIRTHALWGQTRRILYVLAGSYLVILAGAFSCLALYGVAIDKFGGCDLPANTQQPLVAGYILLVVLEIEVLVLSVYKAIQLYRESRGTLLVLLVQHNVGYFAACLALNGINMISAVGVETHDNAMMEVTQIILQALLATRMQIDLWKSASGRSDSPTDEMTLMEFAERDNIRQETELVNT